MAVPFLSEDWMAAVTDALNGHEGFSKAIETVDLSLQFVVTDVPEGDETHYYLAIDGGTATLAPGDLEEADATITNSYETASGISKGELNTQMAFMTGKLKVSGNMAKLMMNQSALSQWAQAVADLDVEYS
ncbi:MAG: SCP2 sterol-binding domain-containing protein [Acidimicrobiia bacterium]